MPYSRTRVDRAGRVAARFLEATARGDKPALAAIDRASVLEAIEVIDWWRHEHARSLSRVAANLSFYASQHGAPAVAQRLKRTPSIVQKLIRQRSMRLSQMADIGGVRAVLPDLEATRTVAANLRRNWTIIAVADYIAEPKPDGYRALHVINRHRGRLVEIQLRTPRQHSAANAVEADARQFAPALKWGSGPQELTDYYTSVAELFALADADEHVPPALHDEVERLQERADRFRSRRRG